MLKFVCWSIAKKKKVHHETKNYVNSQLKVVQYYLILLDSVHRFGEINTNHNKKDQE